MNTFLNYVVEANAGLLFFLLLYFVLFRNETNFSLVRYILLGGITASLLFPLVNFEAVNTAAIPSLSNIIPSYWLPEVIIEGDGLPAVRQEMETAYSLWSYIGMAYWLGVVVSGIMFALQLAKLLKFIRQTVPSHTGGMRIAELSESDTTFSFFHFIFIGNASKLSDFEKQRIIDHENTHAKQWHSIDMMLLRLLQIVFWFNPFINVYKKIFVQVHEFEADARAVENQDVDRYCSLLARVALRSAGLSIANHFNNSLTLKRIQMMRTIKSGIKRWKIAACAIAIPLLFFVIACQDQIADSETELPAEVQTKFEEFKQKFPGENFIVEYRENAEIKLKELESHYGHAKHIELITVTVDGKQRTFSMLQFVKVQNVVSASDEVYESVDNMAEYDGGMPGLVSYLSDNIRYPSLAREQGIEGTTFISFIIEKDGSISDVKVVNGFDEACDNESERVVKAMGNWKPAKHQGEVVRSRLTLPIKFKLN